MLSYRGKYRVCYEFDKRTGKPLEFNYIKCRNKIEIFRHKDKVLVTYIQSRIKGTYLLKLYPDLFKLFQDGDKECTLLFNESDMEVVANILGAMTKGCNVSPRSKRNIK